MGDSGVLVCALPRLREHFYISQDDAAPYVWVQNEDKLATQVQRVESMGQGA